AALVSSRWTMSPVTVDRRGLEPRFSPREGDVFPLDQQPETVETMGIEPISDCLQGSLAFPWNMRPHLFRGPPGGRTRTSSLPRRRAAVTPADLGVTPDGLEPSFPPCEGGVVATGPRDRSDSSRGRNRTGKHITRLSTWPLYLFAYSAVKSRPQ